MRIRWVKVWVDAMATLTERFRDEEGRVDFEALGREEYAFRHALVTGDFSRSERARDIYEATLSEITARSEAGRKSAEARRNKKNTADATTREGVDESTTGCKNSGEGGISPEVGCQASSLPSPTPIKTDPKPTKKAKAEVKPEEQKYHHGEFGNVMLTDDEFAKLQEKLPNAWELITELDQYIESQGKTKKYKSHYATLLNWSRRKAQEAEPKQGFKTAADRDREEIQKIADYYAAQERGEKPPMPKIQLVEGL